MSNTFRILTTALALWALSGTLKLYSDTFTSAFGIAAQSEKLSVMLSLCPEQLKHPKTSAIAKSFLNFARRHRQLPDGAFSAYALALTGQFERSIERFRIALSSSDVDSHHFEAMEQILYAALHHDQISTVVRMSEQWAARDPESELPFLLAARCLIRTEHFKAAETNIRVARLVSPSSPHIPLLLGQIALKRNRLNAAREHFRTALTGAAQPFAMAGLVNVECRERDFEAAISLAGILLREHPSLLSSRLAMVRALRAAGKYETALDLCKKTVNAWPLASDAALELCITSERLTQDTDHLWRRFVELEPKSPRSLRVRSTYQILRIAPNLSGHHPTWSPDGRFIASIQKTHKSDSIVIVDAANQIVTRSIVVGLDGTFSHLAWSPDGQRLAFHARPRSFGEYRPGVYVKDLDSTLPAWMLLADVSRPRFSPDGWQLLVTKSAENGGILSVDLTGHIVMTASDATWADWSSDGRSIVGSERYTAYRGDIWLYQSRIGKPVRRLTRDFQNLSPRYRPDGDSISFLRKESHSCASLYATQSDLGDALRVYEPPSDEPIFHHDWAPDGRSMVVGFSNGRSEIVEFGGLVQPAIDTSFSVDAQRLVITIANRTGDLQTCRVTYRIFDTDSQELSGGRLTQQPLVLDDGEIAFRVVELPETTRRNGVTIKLSTFNASGETKVLLEKFPGTRHLANDSDAKLK